MSRELGVTAARASQWRDQFLAAGQAGLKSRAPDARDEEHQRLHAKVGELLMENELLYAKVDHLEAGGPLGRCCTNRQWPARGQSTGSSPADAIRHWSAESGHPIEDLTAENGLTPLPSWTPGAKAISDDGLVAEERILHPALTMGV